MDSKELKRLLEEITKKLTKDITDGVVKAIIKQQEVWDQEMHDKLLKEIEDGTTYVYSAGTNTTSTNDDLINVSESENKLSRLLEELETLNRLLQKHTDDEEYLKAADVNKRIKLVEKDIEELS